MLRRSALLVVVLAAVLAVSVSGPASGMQAKAFQLREDFGNEPSYDCCLNYYYYIPCATTSWFWMYTGWHRGDIIGAWYQVGDRTMGTLAGCDPVNCQSLEQFRVLDFAGYGCYAGGKYEGLYTVRFNVYCADENGCPVGPSLWSSGPFETCEGWNYVSVSPPLSLCRCATAAGPPPSRPRILITATHIGTAGVYPAWGLDNVSTPVGQGCNMHDNGCLPALYPRPSNGYYSSMHSGYFGNGSFQYCPAQWFKDGRDSTPTGTRYGYIELTWRIYLACTGPSKTEATTWGAIKSMYR